MRSKYCSCSYCATGPAYEVSTCENSLPAFNKKECMNLAFNPVLVTFLCDVKCNLQKQLKGKKDLIRLLSNVEVENMSKEYLGQDLIYFCIRKLGALVEWEMVKDYQDPSQWSCVCSKDSSKGSTTSSNSTGSWRS